MKKFLMAIFALAVATTVATAGVGILWSTQYGAYDSSSPDVVGGSTALLDNYSAIWQLIYAGADNAIDSIENVIPTAGGPNGDYVVGDDVVWAQRTIALGGGTAAEDGTAWTNWLLDNGGANASYEDLSWSTAGFVYQRVFEINPLDGAPVDGSYYHETALLALNTGFSGGGQPYQDFFIDTPLSGFQPDIQIDAVPEPATMSLLGLGALVMAIRRRRS